MNPVLSGTIRPTSLGCLVVYNFSVMCSEDTCTTKNNKTVYSYGDNFSLYILYHIKDNESKHVNLLFIKNENQTHYYWIKDLSKLISSQLSKHNGKRYHCDWCLIIFYCQEKLDEHEELRKDHKAVKIEMPKIWWKNIF